MVRALVQMGITDSLVLGAIEKVERYLFVPAVAGSVR